MVINLTIDITKKIRINEVNKMHIFGTIGATVFSLALGIMILTLIKVSLYEQKGMLKLRLSLKEIWFKALLFFIIMYAISAFVIELILVHNQTDVSIYLFRIIGYISLLSIAIVLLKIWLMRAKEKKVVKKGKKTGENKVNPNKKVVKKKRNNI